MEFLLETQNPKFVLHTTLSPKQWAGISDKQNLIDCLKEQVGASQRKVGRGTARRFMGLPDHAWATHRKHSLRPCIRHGRSHPHGNRLVHDSDCRTRTKWWKYETRKKPRLGGWNKKKCVHPDDRLPTKSGCSLQPQGTTLSLQDWNTCPQESFWKHRQKGARKFQANWEGPYIIFKAGENGAYHLQKLDGTPLLRSWNVSNLKQYYQ